MLSNIRYIIKEKSKMGFQSVEKYLPYSSLFAILLLSELASWLTVNMSRQVYTVYSRDIFVPLTSVS